MITQKSAKWLKTAVKAFLITTGLVTVTVAATNAIPPVRQAAPTEATSRWVPPGHEANSGTDIGPGSDEGLLVSSP